MANYPVLPTSAGSKEKWIDPLMVSTMRGGATRIRRTASAKKREWQLVHKMLTATQRTALETFYDTNRALIFVFTWNANNYNVVFTAELEWGVNEIGDRWDVNVTLREA